MNIRSPQAAAGAVLAGALLAWLAASPLAATEVQIFQSQSRAAMVAGTLEGISVDPLGRLELADRIERLTGVAEPFVFAAAAHPEGWVIGTGNAGRVLLVDRRGEVRELFAAPEPEVFALWVDPDGTVFAGTSPNGKVYRIVPGKGGDVAGEELFDPGETYIWALGRDSGGDLLVATGTQGKLYRVRDRGRGKPTGEVAYDSDDTHLRSLAVLPDGDVLVGTAGEGLILRLHQAPAGELEARTLYDADAPEVVTLTAAPDGTAYAALAASEASLVDLSQRPAQDEKPSGGEGEGQVTVQVAEGQAEAAAAGAVTVGTRRGGFQGPRSVVVRIGTGGFVETIAELEEDTVFSLLWHRDRLWLATGLEGKLYSWDGPGSDLVLEKDVDERQLVALTPDDPGPAFVTTNASALYRVTGGTEREGTYTSAALDAREISRFGSFRWRGEVPGKGDLRFAFRSGMSAEPDRTWAPWTDLRRGEEIPLGDLPPGRYVQWRAHLKADDGTSPLLYGIELSYLQENLSPKIERFGALDPGQVLVPVNFNPMNQVWEPAHPNREGIFTTLEASSSDSDGRLKPLWKMGYRTLRWQVSDPNGDQLLFHLDFRPDAGALAAEEGWLRLEEDLEDDHLSFDATVLPDGVYRFRLRVSDSPGNGGSGRTAEQLSEPVVIDHGAPELGPVTRSRDGKGLEVAVSDALSPIREAVVSFDAGDWEPVAPTDGLLDGKREVLAIRLPQEAGQGAEAGSAKLLLLRLTDASFNVVTFDLTGKLP